MAHAFDQLVGLLGPADLPRFALVTCGDWDLASMLPVQCAAVGLGMHELA